MTCPSAPCELCVYLQGQLERLQDETLRLRVEAAEGPRSRVRELELQVERLNRTIADQNQRLRKKAS